MDASLTYNQILSVLCERGKEGSFTLSDDRAARMFARSFQSWAKRAHAIEIEIVMTGSGVQLRFAK